MSELGVYLGGEGPNELGSYAGHPSYFDEARPGVIVALLRQICPTGWRVVGATKWSKIRKLRATGPSPNEARNVRALILDAKEANAEVLAFTRDSDGDSARAGEIQQAILEHETVEATPRLIGGVAVPVLEAWLLALGGEARTEQLSKASAESRFEEKHAFNKVTERVVEYVRHSELRRVPQDALGLRRWIDRATEALSAPVP